MRVQYCKCQAVEFCCRRSLLTTFPRLVGDECERFPDLRGTFASTTLIPVFTLDPGQRISLIITPPHATLPPSLPLPHTPSLNLTTHLNHDSDELQIAVGLQDRRHGHVDSLGLQKHAQLSDDEAASGFQ